MRVRIFSLVFILLAITAFRCIAQNLIPDTSSASGTTTPVIDYFYTTISTQSEIYNGTYYELYPAGREGSYYLKDKNYCTVSVIRYNGTWYKNVPILYDVLNDQMVSSSAGNLFVVNAENITDIYLSAHHFIYLSNTNTGKLSPGYYDALYNGTTQVLVKRLKTKNDYIIDSRSQFFYKDKADIYVKKSDKYYLVNSKSAFMDVFKAQRSELTRYIDDNKIDYKADPELAVIKLVSYYDSINK